MKSYKVFVQFYQGLTNKLLYRAMYEIVAGNEDEAKAYVTNFLRMEDFHNFKITGIEEIS